MTRESLPDQSTEARMEVRSVELRHGRWEVRIKLPDYDVDQPSKDISVGSWQSPDGHGLLISTPDYKDLLAVAWLLAAAGRDAQRESEGT